MRLAAQLTDSLEDDYVQWTRAYQGGGGDSDDEQVPDSAIEAPLSGTQL